MNRLPIAALVAAGTLWGTTVPLSKDAVVWAGPGWLTALRFALAAPALALFARRGLRTAATPGVALSGAAGYGLVILLQNVGIARTSATHAAILVGAMPAMVAVLCVLLGRAPVRPVAGVGLASALAGVALVAGGGGSGGDLVGDGLVLASLVGAAMFTIAQPRLLEGRDVVAVTAVQLGAAATASTAAAVLMEGGPPMPSGVDALTVLAALVLLGTLVPFTLFAYGQSKVSPEVAGAFMNLEPLVGAGAGVLVLGDPFGPGQALGATAIVAGIVASTWPRRVGRDRPAHPGDHDPLRGFARLPGEAKRGSGEQPRSRSWQAWANQVDGLVAEADGNRTRLAEVLGHFGFEDREGHQAPIRLRARAYVAIVKGEERVR